MLTIVLYLSIAQFPVHSGPSFFFLEVLSTLQKIVLSQSTVVEGLLVRYSAVISTDNHALCRFLKQYFLILIPHTGYSRNMATLCLCLQADFFVKSLTINDESRKTDMIAVRFQELKGRLNPV